VGIRALSSRFPAAFRRAGLRFLGHHLPAEGFGLPCGRVTGLDPDLDGVTTFHVNEKQPGWVSSLLRGLGVLLPGVAAQEANRPNIAALSRCDDPLSRSLIEDSFALTRPVSPLPGHRLRLAVSLGFNLCFRPCRHQRSCRHRQRLRSLGANEDTRSEAFASLVDATSCRTVG